MQYWFVQTMLGCFPHAQSAEFSKVPLLFGQKWVVAHLLRDEEQNRPVVFAMHTASLLPHEQSNKFDDMPSSFGQNRVVEHLLRDTEQNKPAVVVQAASPQMHSATLAVVPSVHKHRGPVAQRQV